MMNFVDKGTDDLILKAISDEGCSDELIKAVMNKQGLVQKQVQVTGKNGKVFMRKQWVRVGDDITQPQQSISKPLSKDEAKQKTKELVKDVTDKKTFMEKVKSKGISWKKSDNAGINWMRCCMALNDHFANGSSFDTSQSSFKKPKIFTEASKTSVSGGGYKAGGGRSQLHIAHTSAKQYIMLQSTKNDGTWGKPKKYQIFSGETPDDVLYRMSTNNPNYQWRFDPDSMEE